MAPLQQVVTRWWMRRGSGDDCIWHLSMSVTRSPFMDLKIIKVVKVRKRLALKLECVPGRNRWEEEDGQCIDNYTWCLRIEALTSHTVEPKCKAKWPPQGQATKHECRPDWLDRDYGRG